jgi:hypothetical protein
MYNEHSQATSLIWRCKGYVIAIIKIPHHLHSVNQSLSSNYFPISSSRNLQTFNIFQVLCTQDFKNLKPTITMPTSTASTGGFFPLKISNLKTQKCSYVAQAKVMLLNDSNHYISTYILNFQMMFTPFAYNFMFYIYMQTFGTSRIIYLCTP